MSAESSSSTSSVTPAAPDTSDKLGSTSDESKGGLFNTGESAVLLTLQGSIASDVAAANTSAVNAKASETAAAASAADAAASFDSFDDRYLGSKSSDPSVDNDGDALLTGALYFNSSDNVIKAWTGSAWILIKPTTTEQGHINTVSGIASNVTTVAGISANVTTVAGISANTTTVAGIHANVTTVAGIHANVTTVAGIHANVTTVAGISSDVTAVAGKATEIGRLGTTDAIADMNTLGTAAIVEDMNILGTSGNVTAMGHLGTSANVTAMGHLGTSANVTAMGHIGTSANVTAMGNLGTSTNVTNMANLNASGVISNIATVSGIASNVTTVAGISANVTTVAGISANTTTVAGISANVTTVAGIHANVTTVAGMNSNIASVVSNATNINTVAGGISNVNTVASNISHVSTVSGAISNVNTVATNITNVNTFANTYFIASSAPTGGTIGEGDLWYDTANDEMKVHNGSSFVTFVSAYDTDDLSEGSSNLYYTNARADARITNAFNSNVTLAGELRGPATFVIDPAVVGNNTGLVQIKGNLQVDGTTTTVNSQTLDVADKNITVANGAANKGAADGGGLTVDCGSDTDATLTYASSDDTWNVNKTFKVNSAEVATQGFAVAMAIAL